MSTIRKRRRTSNFFDRLLRDDAGAAMVEFAIVAAFLFIPMVFGIIEFGRAIFAKSLVTAAAREGVRYAIVRGSSSGAATDSSGIATFVQGRTQLSPITVRPAWEDASKDPGKWVQVTVSYNYVPIVPILGAKTVTGISRQVVAF